MNEPHPHLLALLNTWEQKSVQQGIVVGSIHASVPDFTYRSQDYFIPASCQKLITCLLALKELGHDFHYVTTLQVEPNSSNYRLIFRGDPTLTSQDIASLLLPLKDKTIKGSLIIDHSAFQTPPWSPHWMEEDIGSDYASPLLAAIIDRNAYECVITPEQNGKKASITGLEKVPHSCKAIKASLPRSTVKVLWRPEGVHVDAQIADTDPDMKFTISNPSATVILTQHLQKVLKELDIVFEKGIEFQQHPQPHGGRIIHEHRSPSLEHFLPPAMKRSDNLILDALYLTLLHRHNYTEWSQGAEVFKTLSLKHLGLDFQQNYMIDGSGLARENQIQPQVLWSILKMGVDEPLFRASLPSVMEKETSLAHRSELPHSVMAKTGGMTGINGLCGYGGLGNSPHIFVILQANPAFAATDFYQMQKSICEEVLG